MKRVIIRMQICILFATGLLVSCSSELETPIVNNSDEQSIAVGPETDYGLDGDWEAYFASLDSLDAEFGIYDSGIAVMSSDTAKDRWTDLEKVVFADGMGAVAGRLGGLEGMAVGAIVGSLTEIGNLTFFSSDVKLFTNPFPPIHPTLPSQKRLDTTEVTVNIGKMHNIIIRRMESEKFPFRTATKQMIAEEVIRQYESYTKKELTAQQKQIATTYTKDMYYSADPMVRLGNQRYFDATIRLSNDKLTDYTNNYLRTTRISSLKKAEQDQLNAFASVTYHSKQLWYLK